MSAPYRFFQGPPPVSMTPEVHIFSKMYIDFSDNDNANSDKFASVWTTQLSTIAQFHIAYIFFVKKTLNLQKNQSTRVHFYPVLT